ncbi:MAG: FecR domain-containing protein [Verrucomicrobiales bacterium]|nr:FecR domain-containing protein [Verrucomicrobiales bacterium]
MNDDLLTQGYLDGTLTSEEMAVFQQHLREDGELREHLRAIAEQAVAFGDLARSEPVAAVERPKKSGRTSWLTLAASLAVLAASAVLFLSNRQPAVLTLVENTGTVTWSDGSPIAPQDRLPAGTIATVGETSSAQFRFGDGTLITLHGETELTFSEDGRKILALSRGTLSAEVKPQPAGRPMLVRTPSAEAEVVGTAFDLTARPEDTVLKVNEGLVKLKRLADGSEINVPANRSAVASLDAGSALDAASTPEPLTNWSFDFTTTTPPRDWRGFAKDGAMHASPYVAKKQDDGRVTTHYGVSVRTALLEEPLRLLATGSSVIRYRLRQEEPGSLQFMLLTHRTGGGFGGNFECKIGADELQPDADGWCEIAIPIARFEPIDSRTQLRQRHPTAAGNVITSAIVSSYREDRKLAVARFELIEK